MPSKKVKKYDLIIIGGGVAGLSAGLYAGRYGLKVFLVRGDSPGGQALYATPIENYPGILSISGPELIQILEEQNKRVGVEMCYGRVEILKAQPGHCFSLKINQEIFQAKSLILATGTIRRRLGLPKEEEFIGRGLSFCAICDGPLFKNKIVGVVGGGNSAVKSAFYLSQLAKKVYLFVREDKLQAEKINIQKLIERQKIRKVEILYQTNIQKIFGKNFLEGVVFTQNGSMKEIKLDGLFLEIGAEPNNRLAKDLGLKLDEKGYIIVDSMMRTSLDGVFAAGDVCNQPENFKQLIVAAAQGTIAATSAFRDLNIHGQEACFIQTQILEN